jgi:hypothetical protein
MIGDSKTILRELSVCTIKLRKRQAKINTGMGFQVRLLLNTLDGLLIERLEKVDYSQVESSRSDLTTMGSPGGIFWQVHANY